MMLFSQSIFVFLHLFFLFCLGGNNPNNVFACGDISNDDKDLCDQNFTKVIYFRIFWNVIFLASFLFHDQ